MSFQKCKPHIITYWNYKNYVNDAIRSEIKTFCSLNETDLGLFKESVFCIFNEHLSEKNTSVQMKVLSWLNNSILLLLRD